MPKNSLSFLIIRYGMEEVKRKLTKMRNKSIDISKVANYNGHQSRTVGTGRFDTEWKRWVESEKQCLAELMERCQMEWLQKGTHEKHLSVYDFEKKMRKAEVAELDQEISDQTDKIASQSFLMEVNEEALQSQEQILEENKAKSEQIRQETEQAKEDLEKVQTDKDRVQGLRRG